MGTKSLVVVVEKINIIAFLTLQLTRFLFDWISCFRSVLVVLGIAPESQTSSQTQITQAQVGPGQTGDATNLDKEVVSEKDKESSNAS